MSWLKRVSELRMKTGAFQLHPTTDHDELAEIPAQLHPRSDAVTLVATDKRRIVAAVQVRDAFGHPAVRFWVSPQHRGQRLGTSVLRAVVSPLFTFNIQRVETRLPLTDIPAIRSAMRAGFRPESVVRRGINEADGVVLALVSSDRPGPAPRLLPDIAPGELSTGRIHLRPLQATDTELFYASRCVPEFVEQAVPQIAPTFESVRRLCEYESGVDWLCGEAARLVVEVKERGQKPTYCGSVNAYNVSSRIGEAMIGYELSREWRGQGIASQAVTLLCDWLFDQAGFARLAAGTDVHNIASQSVLRRAGFTLEGTLRGELPGPGNTRRDILRWSKLHPEYETIAVLPGKK